MMQVVGIETTTWTAAYYEGPIVLVGALRGIDCLIQIERLPWQIGDFERVVLVLRIWFQERQTIPPSLEMEKAFSYPLSYRVDHVD